MSLALSLNPCTGLNLAGDHFRPGDFSVSAVVDGYICKVFATQTPQLPWTHPTNCFLEHPNGGGNDLSISGPVWLDVFVWDGLSFVRGGYLEERQYTYTFNSTPLSFRALGVRPAAYTGGVKIEGLHTSDQWLIHNTDGYGGDIWYSWSEPFLFSGRRQMVANWHAEGWHEASGGDGPALTAHIGAVVSDDIFFSVDPYTRARSASPATAPEAQTQRAGVGFTPNGGTR